MPEGYTLAENIDNKVIEQLHRELIEKNVD